VKQGILMPRNWDQEKELKQRDVVFKTADQALEFLGANGRLKTRDGDLVLMTNAKGDLILAANKAKSSGGKYYLNKKIIDAVGKDFVSGGGMMRASVSEDEARKVIDLLASGEAMGQPTFFLADNLPDKARGIVERIKGESSAVEADAPASIGERLKMDRISLEAVETHGLKSVNLASNSTQKSGFKTETNFEEREAVDISALSLPFIKEALAAGANLDHVSFQYHGSNWTIVSFANAKGTYLLKGDDVYVTHASVKEGQAAIEADPVELRGIKLQLAGDIEIRVSEVRSTENRIESRARVVEHSLSM
jgi:hypothetical protein